MQNFIERFVTDFNNLHYPDYLSRSTGARLQTSPIEHRDNYSYLPSPGRSTDMMELTSAIPSWSWSAPDSYQPPVTGYATQTETELALAGNNGHGVTIAAIINGGLRTGT